MSKQQVAPIAVSGVGPGLLGEPGYDIERPYGLGEYLLVRYRAPMLTRTIGGVVLGQPGDLLLCEPSFSQWFSTRATGHVFDWVHFSGPAIPDLVSRYRVPVNTLLQLAETDFVTPVLESISRELHRKEPFYEDSVRTLIETLLLNLGRLAAARKSVGLRPGNLARIDRLRNVRMEVHSHLERRWTVASMARLAYVSGSHFTAQYRNLFGVSPVEDLVRARVAMARSLLTASGVSVSDAASRAGFTSLPYFSRCFRRRVGCAPRDYQRRGFQGGGSSESAETAPAAGTPQPASARVSPRATGRRPRRRARQA